MGGERESKEEWMDEEEVEEGWKRDGGRWREGGGRDERGMRRREEKGGMHVAGREGVWVGR